MYCYLQQKQENMEKQKERNHGSMYRTKELRMYVMRLMMGLGAECWGLEMTDDNTTLTANYN